MWQTWAQSLAATRPPGPPKPTRSNFWAEIGITPAKHGLKTKTNQQTKPEELKIVDANPMIHGPQSSCIFGERQNVEPTLNFPKPIASMDIYRTWPHSVLWFLTLGNSRRYFFPADHLQGTHVESMTENAYQECRTDPVCMLTFILYSKFDLSLTNLVAIEGNRCYIGEQLKSEKSQENNMQLWD